MAILENYLKLECVFFRKSVSLLQTYSTVSCTHSHSMKLNWLFTHTCIVCLHTHIHANAHSLPITQPRTLLFNTHWQIHAQLHTHTCFHTHTLLICASLSFNLLPSLPLSTSFRSNVSSLSLSFSMYLSLMFYYSFLYYSVT